MVNLQPLGAVAPGELGSARKVLHHAVQLIAAAGQALAEPKPDDSHRSMTWEPELMAFRGVVLKDSFYLRVGAADLTAAVVETGGTDVIRIGLAGKPLVDSLKLLQEAMPIPAGDRLFEFPIFDESLPDQEFIKKPLQPAPADHQLELALHYAHAFRALERVVKANPGADPIRVWPHHFDIATILRVGQNDEQMGLGLSPGDKDYAEPYWYLTPWPLPPNATRPEAPRPANWRTEGWTGLVLKSSELLNSRSDPDELLVQTLSLCIAVAKKSILYK